MEWILKKVIRKVNIIMRRKLIGRKHFEGTVDITDPCYDKDVRCRMSANVKSGTYDCRIWMQPQKYKDNYGEHKYETVGLIGIYLDGVIPVQKEMKKIGSIGVDAGLAGFFMNKPDYTDEQWMTFCESIRKGNAWIKDEGFFSHSGFGDGVYPVFSYQDENGEITALEICFA